MMTMPKSNWATTKRVCRTCQDTFLPERWSTLRCLLCRTICAADGCDRKVQSGGLCGAHYWRQAKKGEIGQAYIRPARGDRTNRAKKHPSIQFTCQGCGADFTAPPSIAFRKADGALTRKYCSNACRHASKDTKPTFVCEGCGETKILPKDAGNQGYRYGQKFCSRKCQHETRCRVGFVDKFGYRIMTIDGKGIPEHRLVMAKKIGRDLFADETVHHKDGDRINNHPDNLELWSGRHGRGQRVEDKIEFCKKFLADHGIKIPHIDASLLLSGEMSCV